MINAYRKALNDPDLQARAIKFGYPIEPAYGQDVAKIINKALQQNDETIALLTEALKPPKDSGK